MASDHLVRKSRGGVAGVALLMSAVLLSFAAQRPVAFVVGAVICAAYACAHFSPVSRQQVLVFLCAAALFLPGLAKPYHGLSPLFYFFSTVSTFLAARAVTEHRPEVLLAAVRVIYTVSVVGIGVSLYTYWGEPEPLGLVIEGSSTNAIPSYLIVIQIGLSLCSFLMHRQLPILSPLLTAAVAFFGNGRASLVVAGLIIVASVLLNLKLTGSLSRRRQLAFFLVLIAAMIPLAWNAEELLDLLVSYTKLSVGLVDTNRLEILEQYVGKIEPLTLLFGADYSGTVIDYEYLGNPHIAYIRTHSLFGLPVTILALLSPFFLFFSRRTLTAKLVFFCFVFLGALRALAEPIFFPTLLDFFYFIYFFLFFRYAPLAKARGATQGRVTSGNGVAENLL